MRNFIITTDSNSDLPQTYIDKLGTVIIPQYYSFGDTVYGDELNMPPAEFYERMKNGELPQSQANNPAVIEDKFRAVLEEEFPLIHKHCEKMLFGDGCLMYKLLLATNAEPVRAAFTSLPWEMLGFRPPRVAESVEEAISSLKAYHADAIAIALPAEEDEVERMKEAVSPSARPITKSK